MKRAFDVSVSATALLILSPVLLGAAVATRLSSPGPVLFRHERLGRDREPFELLKFRTMRAGSEGPQVTSGSDPRITAVGAVLRRTKIDELPQLVNVVRGEMSLVGPRPEVATFVDRYPAEYDELLTVRPGITDPASVSFRHEAELLAEQDDPEDYYINVVMPQKLELSLRYVRSAGLATDLAVLGQTARAVLS